MQEYEGKGLEIKDVTPGDEDRDFSWDKIGGKLSSGEMFEFVIGRSRMIELAKKEEIIKAVLANDYGDLNLERKDVDSLVEKVSVTVFARIIVDTDTKKVDLVFVNGKSYSLSILMAVSPLLWGNGEVNLELTASELNNLKQENAENLLISTIIDSIKEQIDLDDYIEKKKKEELDNFNDIIEQSGGASSLFNSHVISKLENDLNDSTTLSAPNGTVGKLAVKLLSEYSIPSSVVMSFFERVSTVAKELDMDVAFYEDYIMNHEEIYWNPEEQVGKIFRLFESKELKDILLDRYKLANNLKQLEEKAKNILDFINKNENDKIVPHVNNIESILEEFNTQNSVMDSEMTDVMQAFNNDEYKYNKMGIVTVDAESLAEMVGKVVTKKDIPLNEDTLLYIFNNCNTDTGSPEYPFLSIKENIGVLHGFLERETCPNKLLKTYFLVDPKFAKIILNNPRLESNEELVKDIFYRLKKKLNTEIENEEWASVYYKFKKFPYLNDSIKGSIDDTLLGYSEKLRNKNDVRFLESEWDNIYNYDPSTVNWPYSFGIDGKESQLLTIIIKNPVCSQKLFDEYLYIFGSNDEDYQKAVEEKVSSGEGEEWLSRMNPSEKIAFFVKKQKEGVNISEKWVELLEQKFNEYKEGESSVNNLLSKMRALSPDSLLDNYESEVSNFAESISEDIFEFFKRRAVDSTDPAELDAISSLVRGSLTDKRQKIVTMGVNHLDSEGRNVLLQYVLNNHSYKVGDLMYWIENPDRNLTNYEKFRGVMEQELEQIKDSTIQFDESDFSSVAKNIKGMLSLKEEQVDSIKGELDLLKKDVKDIVLHKYCEKIESITDETELLSILKSISGMSSNELPIFEDHSLNNFNGLVVSVEELEPIMRSFCKNKYTPYPAKSNIAVGYWNGIENAPVAIVKSISAENKKYKEKQTV